MYYCITRPQDTERSSKTLQHLSGITSTNQNASHSASVLLLVLFTSAVHHWAVTLCKPRLTVMLCGRTPLFHTRSYLRWAAFLKDVGAFVLGNFCICISKQSSNWWQLEAYWRRCCVSTVNSVNSLSKRTWLDRVAVMINQMVLLLPLRETGTVKYRSLLMRL